MSGGVFRCAWMIACAWSALSCSPVDSGVSAASRWYTSEQVESGRTVFLAHCASCHGENAQGTSDWRVLGSDGHYPPPPLNGSAHAWHHPLEVLEQTVIMGGAPWDGVMPAFGDALSREEIRAGIAYFQSFWSDEIYMRWRQMFAK